MAIILRRRSLLLLLTMMMIASCTTRRLAAPARAYTAIASPLLSAAKDSGHFLQSTYKDMAKESDVHLDEHQLRALEALDRLYVELQTFVPPSPPPIEEISSSSSFWNVLSSTAKKVVQKTLGPKGVYLHGGVGCGKTFCMNLFYNQLDHEDKQLVHFHKFMLGVHAEMHEAKKTIKGDVLPQVVQQTLNRGRILCFDEFQVTDVADALILQRLFTSLMEQGAIVVATSNRPPEDLYLGGLQRDRFIPFIDMLVDRSDVVGMWESEVDYRLVQGTSKAKGVYFIGADSLQGFDAIFDDLTAETSIVSTTLSTQGRKVVIPRATSKGIARFSFKDLCTKALGAADYLVIGQHFHTVFVQDIPMLDRSQINWVRRLIVFVDAMYESHVKLIIQAETQPEGIFRVDLEDESCDEVFAFDRTRSRLEEMRSKQYLRKRWAGSRKGVSEEK